MLGFLCLAFLLASLVTLAFPIVVVATQLRIHGTMEGYIDVRKMPASQCKGISVQTRRPSVKKEEKKKRNTYRIEAAKATHHRNLSTMKEPSNDLLKIEQTFNFEMKILLFTIAYFINISVKEKKKMSINFVCMKKVFL